MIDICDELRQNAVDFAYEANSQRAFADARDGLKPGQRACIWEMYERGYTSNKPHVKSAKVSGGVIATWWPHSREAIYETFARMSMPWINNVCEVDWHGANGNQIIGNTPAADRYTETRLSKATEDGMLQGIKKNNVPMIKNFSEDAEWPEVLPSIFPRLLVNGCQGIGYTIANTWLPCSLNEVSAAIINYIKTGEIDNNAVKPDFPSGGIIINGKDLYKINESGKGKVLLRARTEIKKDSILITELPYQVYIEPLIDDIKKLIVEDTIIGIRDIYNKSDKKKLLIEIECEKGKAAQVLKQLFTVTDLQKSYNANQYALVSKTPMLLNLKDYFDIYIRHNLECIKRENTFDLKKASDRIEIVNGLLKALEDIDNIISLIKKSENATKAQENLINKYGFTMNQAKAIVEMKLGRLAHLESIELNQEKEELSNKIKEINNILSNSNKQKDILINRLTTFTKKYGSPRKTQILELNETDVKEEKAKEEIPSEDVIVIFNNDGYVKRVPQKSIKVQRRGGKGSKTKEESVLTSLTTNTQNYLFIFTKKGKMYKLLVNDIPANENTHVGNLIGLNSDDSLITVSSFSLSKYIVFFTKKGYIKKSLIDDYKNVKRKTGITAIKLQEGDSIVNVEFMNDEEVMLISKGGLAVKVETKDIAPIGRNAIGVKGMKLQEQDCVIAASAIRDSKNECIGTFTENGYGKMTRVDEFYIQGRNGRGVFVYKPSEETGKLVSALVLTKDDNILIIGKNNTVSIAANDIPVTGRMTTGVIVTKDDKIKSVMKV